MTDGAAAVEAAAIMRAGSKSFAAATRLFTPAMRESAVLLYAWCRHCDDVVDGQDLGFTRREGRHGTPAERLAVLEEETRRALRGEPALPPAFAGLQAVVRRHAIPDRYPVQHLRGFGMDVEGRRYETMADTLDYAYHVAGVVGVMMAYVMGVREPVVLDRASDLGLAFQLTNIARDVIEDAGAGRVYLPAEWLIEAGLPDASPEAVRDPRRRPAVAAAARRLVAAAEPYYASARLGIGDLPGRAAWAIAAARGIYRDIGLAVTRHGEAAWDRRISTSNAAKLRHVALGALTVAASRSRPAAARDPGLYLRPA